MSLSEVFNTSEVEEKVDTEVEAEAQADAVEGDADESETTSQDEAKADNEVKTESDAGNSEEEKEKTDWTLAAVKDERRKRQELERKLAELESRQTERQESKELPDVFDDQKAFVDSIRDEYRRELAKTKLEIAREMMLDTHDDYEDMERFFIDTVAKDNPVLAEEARKASNPAKFVYQNAKKYKEYKEMQDVDSMREKMREQIRAELQAEFESASKSKADKVSTLKPSLAKARASDKDSFEPETLSSIFGA